MWQPLDESDQTSAAWKATVYSTSQQLNSGLVQLLLELFLPEIGYSIPIL